MANTSPTASDALLVQEYTYASGTVSQTGTVHLIDAPGAARRLVVDYFTAQLSGATATAGTVQFGTVATASFDLEQYSAYGFGAAHVGHEWRLPTNTALVFSAAGTSQFRWSARYFTESVY